MDNVVKKLRMELLEGMNDYILDMGDEEPMQIWWSLGIPDCPTDDDYEWIAENDEEWTDIVKLFGTLIREYDNDN